MATTYGTGTPTQFTDGSARQVLELGKKVHMYNPDMTPMYTMLGRLNTLVTPVPIFEWMEDEWFVKPSVVVPVAAGQIIDQTTGTVNDHGSIIQMNKQSDIEAFEKGAVYKLTLTTTTAGSSAIHAMCTAIGKDCGTNGSESDLNVQFILGDYTDDTTFRHQLVAMGTAMFATAGTIQFDYVGIAGVFSAAGVPGASVGQATLADNETAPITSSGQGFAEGAAVGTETRKKVRRLKNCTQIFREPYTITGTADAAQHYGGPEMARLQARKLTRLKADVEWAILTNGAIELNATAENPKRTFQGFGVGGTTGAVQSLNGASNTDLQWTEAAAGDLDAFDLVSEKIFGDMISGTMRKTVFCSNRWMRKLTATVRSEGSTQIVHEMGQDATAGLRVATYYGPIGEMEFIVHPMLNGALDAYALAVDFPSVNWRPLQTRDIQLRSNIVRDGRDGTTSEWLIEAGMEIRNEQTHAVMKLV